MTIHDTKAGIPPYDKPVENGRPQDPNCKWYAFHKVQGH